ncbi:SDR family oxidoreductase [Acidisphaera sp. L21]|uniref:SDR family oxidoreductase n=1 Tax=Acidisphaera sp. L21 TaxID=1641851 RepID=UPI00131D8C04|nr:SDR family NAD(P)-dependent oxidoreductase [Acidisphaera sp. L21]
MKLEHRTILITGGTSGIGRELAREMLKRGNVVIVTGRDQGRLDEVGRELPGIHTIQSDAADPSAIEALHKDVLARFPGLDTLINNAGIMRNLTLGNSGLLDVTREITINFSGPVQMVQRFLPHLLTRPGALIVNVSSGLAFLPFPSAPIYCATKAAIHSFTQSLRVQLEGSGVTVVELAPPGTETPLFRAEFEREMKNEKAMDPKLLAQRAISGIEAGKLEIRPGVANVLKIMSRVAPSFMLKQMTKLSRRT